MISETFILKIRQAAEKRILFLPHAVAQMTHPQRMITAGDIRNVIKQGEIIEEYPEDSRGHSALLLGNSQNKRSIHVVCSPKNDYLAIITAYIPDAGEWSEDYRRRK